MSAKVKGFLAGYAVFVGMMVLTNVIVRPMVRKVSEAAKVPALGNLI